METQVVERINGLPPCRPAPPPTPPSTSFTFPSSFISSSTSPPRWDWISFLACSRMFLMASSDPVSGVRMRGVMLPATEGNTEGRSGEEEGWESGMADQRALPKAFASDSKINGCLWARAVWGCSIRGSSTFKRCESGEKTKFGSKTATQKEKTRRSRRRRRRRRPRSRGLRWESSSTSRRTT